MKTRNTLAVVDDTTIIFLDQLEVAQREIQGITTLKGLLSIAELQGFTHLWIVAGSQISATASARQEIPCWNIVRIGPNDEQNSFIAARRSEHRSDKMIYIGFQEYWPWKAAKGARALLMTLFYLENTLMLPIEWTPAHMSLEVVRWKNANRWHWLQPMTLDLEQIGFSYTDDIAKELNWPEKGQIITASPGSYTIRIDGNSDYASAMTSLNVGEGHPLWFGEIEEQAYDGNRPGFWYVHVWSSGDSIFDGVTLPAWKSGWMTTDLIEQLRSSGYQLDVRLGWYWKQYHQTLRSTAEFLWDKRVEWREQQGKSGAHKSVYESLRQIIKAIHGKMARADTAVHFRRRDIWSSVVACAVARRLYRIEKIYKATGLKPVKIAVDELTYEVSDPHVLDAFIDLDRLGGFKLVELMPGKEMH